MNNQNDKKEVKTVKVPAWLFLIMLFVFLAITACVLYLRFIRYMIAADVAESGDITSTALFLTPEIAAGLARLF